MLLADVAIRIQLSPTDYQLAIDHYHAINEWLEREDSPLAGFVRDFYPQGGFAIGATVARHSTDDEFDIDVMADLAYRTDVDPEDALAILHDAIRGERGSRYYLKTDRKTRCSTVNYDGMHLDVTPTVRLTGTIEKTGLIFHSKPEEPWEPKMSLYANPHGFAQWFISRTPPDQDFGTFFERRSLDYDRERSDPVEARRRGAGARALPRLPEVACGHRAAVDQALAQPGLRQAARRPAPAAVGAAGLLRGQRMPTRRNRLRKSSASRSRACWPMLGEAHDRGQKVFASNPMCHDDILTDRWPADLSDQAVFIHELTDFAVKLRRLRGDIALPEMQQILEDLFGEKPARSA